MHIFDTFHFLIIVTNSSILDGDRHFRLAQVDLNQETPEGPLRKFLGFKEHLNWLKIDLNAAEIITIQDYKCTKLM